MSPFIGSNLLVQSKMHTEVSRVKLAIMKNCPKCDADMEMGWISDSATKVKEWRRGVFTLNFLGRPATPADEDRIPLKAYRCIRCGFVEFYAK